MIIIKSSKTLTQINYFIVVWFWFSDQRMIDLLNSPTVHTYNYQPLMKKREPSWSGNGKAFSSQNWQLFGSKGSRVATTNEKRGKPPHSMDKGRRKSMDEGGSEQFVEALYRLMMMMLMRNEDTFKVRIFIKPCFRNHSDQCLWY